MSALHPPTPGRRPRRLATLAVWALAVLVLHGLLLAGWPAAPGPASVAAPQALSVRQIVVAPLEPPEPSEPPEPLVAPAPRPPLAARQPSPPLPEPAPSPVAAGADRVADTAADAVAEAPAEPQPAGLAEEPRMLRTAAMAEPAARPAGAPPPTYRTRLPPATELHYELRRGAITGDGLLRWLRSGDSYELTMEGSVFGFQVLSQVSRGGFDLAGVAPLRFVDRRRGRDLRAANFQRDKGLVTFSGSSSQHPLLPGTQDRLSWLVQLAAIVDADAARFRAGEPIEMAVSGSRGDTDVWTFTVVGHEAVELVGTRLERVLVLRREPRKPYDTRVEVWLDPGRHHLPVRIRLSSERGGEALDFVLRP